MGWERFVGNARAVEALRHMIAEQRMPQSLALAGPEGVGKFLMATMAARALNCEREAARRDGDFCGVCSPCRVLAPLENSADHPELGPLVAERGKLSAEERRDNPLLIGTHPDVLVLPPDGKAHLITIHQVRRMASLAQYRPTGARHRVFILDGAERMDEVAASAMLKVLEEPPPATVLLLVATSYFALLPTIRSRAYPLRLGPLAAGDVERLLPPEWSAADRSLAARLAEGSPGAARRLDLAESRRLRGDLLEIIRAGAMPGEGGTFGTLFSRTQSLAQSRDQTLERLLAVLYTLLHDLAYLVVARERGRKPSPLRNIDLERELAAVVARADWEWIERAAARLDRLQRLLRRNINKQVALEAFAVSLRR
ncbi:MAG: ATP-binding protein [Terriglobales bacterium]